MKTSLSLVALAIVASVPAQAQLFTPATVGGAALGAVAGGVIGNNAGSGGRGTKGAVIGAVAGGLIGSAVAQSRREAPSAYYPGGYYGGGYSYYGYNIAPGYTYYSTGPAYAPAAYRPTPSWAQPSRTATTTLLGGVAGAIIGHNNGRHAWQGAAIGAGAGYILGRVIEPRPRYVSAGGYAPYAYYSQPTAVVVAQPAPVQQQPQSITIINNNYYGGSSTPMSNANAMFGR